MDHVDLARLESNWGPLSRKLSDLLNLTQTRVTYAFDRLLASTSDYQCENCGKTWRDLGDKKTRYCHPDHGGCNTDGTNHRGRLVHTNDDECVRFRFAFSEIAYYLPNGEHWIWGERGQRLDPTPTPQDLEATHTPNEDGTKWVPKAELHPIRPIKHDYDQDLLGARLRRVVEDLEQVQCVSAFL